MTRLFIADIHANLPAFEAVLEAAGHVDEVVFLGDVIGCGPYPAECVHLLMSLSPCAIAGNHDLAILRQPAHEAAAAPAGDWDAWSRCQLSEAHAGYLAALPLELNTVSCGETVRLIHKTDAPYYLHPAMPDRLLAEYFRCIPGGTVYCGHSHRLISRVVDGRRLVCLPPVGQPRNGDPRAGYALEIDGVLEFHFVAYDVETVITDLARVGLPDAYRQRWECFLRRGCDPEWSREYRPE
ncbi:MAG: hypothetical protein A3K19_20495 [Lentisphaerae bacterium RIFOXYB12_FULL_65_16]|nr:MAG: hypothetical protein A3K18_32625 [Lentisphaerae bacterium RIFOXYA12_64_32]OGV89341.1 MAG: hypothetical protein A3K19_20495 [Lentisphaerae bacterium RIFOXYB12_FULL_65_16]